MAIDAPVSESAQTGIPRWAILSGLALLAAGGSLWAAREPLRRSFALSAINAAIVNVSPQDDGFKNDFAETTLESNQREYQDLLGHCHRQPELALEVFHRALEGGSNSGRILACRMAYFLAQEGRLTPGDMGQIAGHLDPSRNSDLRRVAQWSLSQVLAISDPSKAAHYETLAAPKDSKLKLQVKTEEQKRKEFKYLTIRWSNPDACKAWWDVFGPGVKWNPELKRFSVP
jgi:hypothetical protein